MIYVQTNDGTYAFDGHIDFSDTQNGYVWRIPYSELAYGNQTGFAPKEAVLSIPTTVSFNPFEMVKLSTNNVYWYDVLYVESLDDSTRPDGWEGMYHVKAYLSYTAKGTTNTFAEQWGHSSLSVSQNGNHEAPITLKYYAPRFYFPLQTSLQDFAGSGINFTRANGKTYNSVSYSANEPIFDEGLYIGGDDDAQLTVDKDYSDFTLFFILRKKGGDYSGTILENHTQGWKIDWASSTSIRLTSPSSTTLEITFPGSDYDSGNPVAVILRRASGTNYFACGVYDETNHTITTPATDSNTENITLNEGDVLYLGNDGANFLQGDTISHFLLYDYSEADAETKEWYLTTEPIKVNDLFIANKIAGLITLENGKLTDEDGNDITYLISGTVPTVESSETITMTAGLSAKWEVEVKDTYVL